MNQFIEREPDRGDAFYRCLADQRRRIVVDYLTKEPTPIVLEAVVKHVGEQESGAAISKDVAISLLHRHLPQMEDAGVIEIDHRRKMVHEGPDFDLANQLLEAVWVQFLMCRSCGNFVHVAPDGDALRPLNDECPRCGGTEFKDNELGQTSRTD